MSSKSLSISLGASVDFVEFPSHLLRPFVIERKGEHFEAPRRFLDAMGSRDSQVKSLLAASHLDTLLYLVELRIFGAPTAKNNVINLTQLRILESTNCMRDLYYKFSREVWTTIMGQYEAEIRVVTNAAQHTFRCWASRD